MPTMKTKQQGTQDTKETTPRQGDADRFSQVGKRADLAFLKVCVIVVIAIVVINYLASLIPDAGESCAVACAAQGKRGELVYIYTKEQTAGSRGRGPRECRCSP